MNAAIRPDVHPSPPCAARGSALGDQSGQHPARFRARRSRRADGDVWDVALIGSEHARNGSIAFTPPYALIEATYLVLAESRLSAIAEAVNARRVDESAMRAIDPELRSFFNLNTPEDYARALQMVRQE